MPQIGRPTADTLIGAWTDELGNVSNIYTGIDEVVAEDAEYVKSEVAPASSPYVVKLTSSLVDPLVNTGHIVRYRYAKSESGGAQIDLTVELREGYVDEGTPGTLIADAVHANVGGAFVDGSFTLSGGEADAITDYSDLYIRFVANQV